ncbi:hypothetical protein BDP55DRAFT_631983 [Colletotrichum godetiae]|uniref:Uncharacterized protein n=1 Tax=Colletotrichum godetiae TaxID=1209918 RepID=A0AAJ0EU57_9PEZI|nr:uncharacterized protein BDP55DRAFT_631983 [Colletotrichum godetiae]KAK1675802.1 hypothetical protein BDP55DRAFT_631983 [Colletotrichum godetiae]
MTSFAITGIVTVTSSVVFGLSGLSPPIVGFLGRLTDLNNLPRQLAALERELSLLDSQITSRLICPDDSPTIPKDLEHVTNQIHDAIDEDMSNLERRIVFLDDEYKLGVRPSTEQSRSPFKSESRRGKFRRLLQLRNSKLLTTMINDTRTLIWAISNKITEIELMEGEASSAVTSNENTTSHRTNEIGVSEKLSEQEWPEVSPGSVSGTASEAVDGPSSPEQAPLSETSCSGNTQ